MRWSCAGLNGMGGGGGGLKMFWIRACVCKLKRFTDKFIMSCELNHYDSL